MNFTYENDAFLLAIIIKKRESDSEQHLTESSKLRPRGSAYDWPSAPYLEEPWLLKIETRLYFNQSDHRIRIAALPNRCDSNEPMKL